MKDKSQLTSFLSFIESYIEKIPPEDTNNFHEAFLRRLERDHILKFLKYKERITSFYEELELAKKNIPEDLA